MLKRSLVLAACGLLVASAGAALAAGSTTTATIAIQSSGDGDTFHGKVTSDNAKCVPARKVKVYLVEGASPDPPNDTLMGKTATNDKGRYHVQPDGGFASPGDFYAKVAKKPLTYGSCKGALSPTVTNN
jgi:hypothetical protein